MTILTYTWLPEGDLQVNAPDDLKPVALLLQVDMTQFPLFLTEAVDHARQQGQVWSMGGNVAWVDLDGERVSVTNQHRDDEVANLSREQFLEILEEFQRELAAGPPPSA